MYLRAVCIRVNYSMMDMSSPLNTFNSIVCILSSLLSFSLPLLPFLFPNLILPRSKTCSLILNIRDPQPFCFCRHNDISSITLTFLHSLSLCLPPSVSYHSFTLPLLALSCHIDSTLNLFFLASMLAFFPSFSCFFYFSLSICFC